MAMRLPEGDSNNPIDSNYHSSRAILALTGLGGPGFSVWPLRDKFIDLDDDAHTVYPPYFINIGIGGKKAVIEAAKKLRDTHDGKPVTGIGWSLGGNHFLSAAYDDPELIDTVFTLGSPCRFVGKKPDEVTVVSFVGRNGKHDGVVPAWLASSPDHNETIKVKANHLMLPYSEEVFDAITHRLGHLPQDQKRTHLRLVR